MSHLEYKVVPAPKKGVKSKGVKTPDARFAYALEQIMNDLGTDGWSYLRAETLPCETRSGLASHSTAYHNVLVFSRPVQDQIAEAETARTATESRPDPQPSIDPAITAVATSSEQSYPETEIDADRARLKSAFDI
ncbi:MAG: DUF4177 domain-containing protein [Rhodobacterales bacterium]|nr:DUF4177 domain-containing protein [Rhodobacterales bacterium]